jgi:HK97 family phage major capsid protein
MSNGLNTVTQLDEARARHEDAITKMEDWDAKVQGLPEDASEEELTFFSAAFHRAKDETRRWAEQVERLEAIVDARRQLKVPDNGTEENKDDTTTTAATTGAMAGDLRVKEPLIYHKRSNNSFFADVYHMTKGDNGAQQRLQRHAAQMAYERRDISTAATAGGEFIPPLWLMDQWVDIARASRPLGNLVRRLALPPNAQSINLPKLATGAAVAVQASENSSVQETDPTTGSVSADVITIAGQVDMSRQLFERSQPGMDEIIFNDLARDYATKLDVQLLVGLGSSGQARGIANVTGRIAVTYTDSNPTVGELYSKIADAVQQVHTNLFRSPDVILMHPRRWGWFLAAVDSSQRPLIVPRADVAFNPVAIQDRVGAENVVGQLQGLAVVVDSSIRTTQGAGTNEDEIFVLSSQDLYLFEEDAPRSRVFEDVGSGTLTVRLQVYGYCAFLATRFPKAIAHLSGTGLAAPTF